MTFRNPSRTSLSLRLSSSFFICTGGRLLAELRELRADCAASRVSSRATEGQRKIVPQISHRIYIPLSSKLDILDMDSMGCHGVVKTRCHGITELRSFVVGDELTLPECFSDIIPHGSRNHKAIPALQHFETKLPFIHYEMLQYHHLHSINIQQ
jgi:hypothetical protein